jgi:hypothetical protein
MTGRDVIFKVKGKTLPAFKYGLCKVSTILAARFDRVPLPITPSEKDY